MGDKNSKHKDNKRPVKHQPDIKQNEQEATHQIHVRRNKDNSIFEP